jgi:exosortase F-associated protein
MGEEISKLNALSTRQRITYGLIAILVLILMYLLQRLNYAVFVSNAFGLEAPSDNIQFIINRSFRFIVNDLSVILLIYVLFERKSLIRIAFALQLFEMLIILPLYFIFKINLEGASEISSPLLSFVHRIVVNPILMLLLIPAFYYQKRISAKK